MSTRTPAEVLRQARRRDSLDKRSRVRATIEEMLRTGDPITFAAVARGATVSTWLVYADGVKEHIEAAIKRQAAQPAREKQAGLTASAASLATDLELARQQVKELRSERDRLRDQIRLRLGQQLEEINSKTLIDRIDELTHANQQLADGNRQASLDNRRLQARVTELEDDLAAARTSLRRVLKETNLAATPTGISSPSGDPP